MDSPAVELKSGVVTGRWATTENGFQYAAFQGMRYAKPPILDRRFKVPEAVDPWNGAYDATFERDTCLQLDSHHDVVGSEDCLHINVYTPKISSCFSMVQVLLPVMVWIHGGGFISGSGNSDYFGPDYIVEQNVILVTLNYRLGVMGFVNLGIDEVPGNVGLRDQVMALKWIKENIQAFGGNRSDVTIFGESTGGASVQYLMLSPMANDLFHKVISHSGSCLSDWSFISEKVDTVERAKNLAYMSDRYPRNIAELIEALREIPPQELVMNANKMRSFDDRMRDAAFVFAPSVEKVYKNVENFIIKAPIEIFASGEFVKVPYISGYNSAEGIYYINYARTNKGHINYLNKNFQYIIPSDMNLEMDSNNSIEVARLIKEFYFKGANIDNSTMYNYIDMYTDYAFLYKIILSSSLIRKSSDKPMYFYKFSFDGDFNYFKKNNHLNYSGACHLDDLGYLFHEAIDDTNNNLSSMSEIVRQRMVKMWTNFAKYGNPTPSVTDLTETIWMPFKKNRLLYLDINNNLKMKAHPEQKRMRFWDKLYKTFKNNSFAVNNIYLL